MGRYVSSTHAPNGRMHGRKVSFTVPAAHESAGLARRLTEAVLTTWRSPVDGEATILLVSELVTNALLYGFGLQQAPEECVTVDLEESADGLHVEVTDPGQGSHSTVVVQDVAQSSESGRGLVLVDALSANWGHKSTSHGKCVYFDMTSVEPSEVEVPATQTPASDPALACSSSQ